MRPRIVLLLSLAFGAPAFAQAPGIPLSERNTQVEARQILSRMKTAYGNLQGYSATVSRVALGPAEEYDNTDSGNWRISWSGATDGKFRMAVDASLAAPPADTNSLFGTSAGPLSVVYDGQKGAISTPSKKVYQLTSEGDDAASIWHAATDAAHFDTLLGSLLYGSDPTSDFPVPLRELRIGKQQMTSTGLCDVVIARFSDNSVRQQRWIMTLLIGHDDGLLRQIITTGSRDGRDRLTVETIVDQQTNARFGGATFRVPALTEKPIFTKDDAPPAPKPKPTPNPAPAPTPDAGTDAGTDDSATPKPVDKRKLGRGRR